MAFPSQAPPVIFTVSGWLHYFDYSLQPTHLIFPPPKSDYYPSPRPHVAGVSVIGVSGYYIFSEVAPPLQQKQSQRLQLVFNLFEQKIMNLYNFLMKSFFAIRINIT